MCLNSFLITYEGHPARSSQRFTSPGARDGGPTLAERVARRHGRRLDRVSGQCTSSNMIFVRNQELLCNRRSLNHFSESRRNNEVLYGGTHFAAIVIN